MAEYNDVINQFKRMCRYYNGDNGECPLYCKGHGCNISHCRMLAFDDKKFANVVMSWAAEHPMPVYPMWCEWLADKGVVDVARMPVDYSGGIITEIKPSGKMYEHIPAEIAQKLGLQPKK